MYTSHMLREETTQQIIDKLEKELTNFNNYSAELIESYIAAPYQFNPQAIIGNINKMHNDITSLMEILRERLK